MKIAIVHDWLTGMRGGERCLEVFLEMYPTADLYSMVHIPGATSQLIDARVAGVSYLQKVPGIQRRYRHFLPFYPSAIRSLDLSGYDVVISLSHAAAKNVSVSPGTLHICYCFTPMRYIWDQAENYFGRVTPLLWPLLKRLRLWDQAGAESVTHFVSISHLVSARIRCFYGRESDIVYPPVNDFWFQPRLPSRKGEAFLYAGALVPYKRVDLIVKACTQLNVPLWVVGTGPMEEQLKSLAGKRVQFFGRVDDRELREIYSNSKALLFAAKEDFGLIPLEVQAVGRPVIGLYHGGLKETVNGIKLWAPDSSASGTGNSPSGVFVRTKENELETLKQFKRGIKYFLQHESAFSPRVCRDNAAQFSRAAFYDAWIEFLKSHALNNLLPVREVYAEREAAAL